MRALLIIPVTIAIAAALVARSIASEPEHDDHDHHQHQDEHAEHSDEVKLTAAAIERYGVKVAPIALHELQATLTAPARVSFNTDAMAHVGSQVSGRASEILVRIGDTVRQGDALLVVESPELGEAQSDFLQERTAVTVAEAAVEPIRASAQRARALYEQSQGISLAEMQKRDAEHKAAQGALETARAAFTAAENKLHLLGMDQKAVEALAKTLEINPRITIRAPLAGQVVEREITLGELVSPDKEALLILANTDTLWVLAEVPEARLLDVAVGAPARVALNADPTLPISGKVSFISPSLDANTRTATVRVEVASDGKLKPGMFAIAEISSRRTSTTSPAAVLAVPESAIQTIEGAPAVFVPVTGEENTFAIRAVTLGTRVGGLVPIVSGLKEGEPVVVAGSFILKAELGKGEAAHEH